MSPDREQMVQHLTQFLRTIQKPDKPIDSIGPHDGLVSSGLIDSLAVVHVVLYLETTYGLDFAAGGLEPERLATISSILDLIEENRK